jgi:hypothetical protein
LTCYFNRISQGFTNSTAMKSSLYTLTTLVILAVSAVCVPINNANGPGWGLVAGGFGMCALLSAFMIGTAGLTYCVKGAISNHNNHKAINYYFDELKKYDKEKKEIAQTGLSGGRMNRTTDGVKPKFLEVSAGNGSSFEDSESSSETDRALVVENLIKDD